jgi:hypothetical protein
MAKNMETGLEWAKVADVKVGDILVTDGGFICIRKGRRCRVHEDDGGLYIRCSAGHHYLDGQIDFEQGVDYVGLTRPS